MYDAIMLLLSIAAMIAAGFAFCTGISVGVNRHLLNFWRRVGVFSSLAASFGFICLIIIWISERGWGFMPELEAFGWLFNHLVAFLAINMYHRDVLYSLGFKTFGESRHNARLAVYYTSWGSRV